MALYVALYCFASCINCATLADKANSPDDNSWYGTPPLQSKPKQGEEPPHEEARLRQGREDKNRRRLEAKRQKSKTVVAQGNTEVSGPRETLAAVSCQDGASQALEEASSTNTSILCPYEDHSSQLSGGLLDLQAGLRSQGVRMKSSLERETINHLIRIFLYSIQP